MLLIETYAPYIFLAGVALAVLGLIALVIAAFRARVAWGVGVLALPPLLGPAFAWVHPRRGGIPLAVLALGLVVAAAPAVLSRLAPVDLGPRDRRVDGERHLTLTGWDRKDYAVLRTMRDAVVLQMANPDVTDPVLEHLEGMDRLRELDLSDTKVTDAGLRRLGGLGSLETLRLKGTAVTDRGMHETLETLPALRQLDLRGTAVRRELVDAWKAAGTGRRALR